MKRTPPGTVVLAAGAGAFAAFLGQFALAAASLPKFRPEYGLALSLVVIAGVVVALAAPIRSATRGAVRRRVDPFHATRVVLFAKASSLAGALLTGAGVGLLVELLTRSGELSTDTLLRTLAVLGGAGALLAAGLVGEFLCTVPPDDPDRTGGPVPGSVEP